MECCFAESLSIKSFAGIIRGEDGHSQPHYRESNCVLEIMRHNSLWPQREVAQVLMKQCYSMAGGILGLS